jgi:hypothetical protein
MIRWTLVFWVIAIVVLVVIMRWRFKADFMNRWHDE